MESQKNIDYTTVSVAEILTNSKIIVPWDRISTVLQEFKSDKKLYHKYYVRLEHRARYYDEIENVDPLELKLERIKYYEAHKDKYHKYYVTQKSKRDNLNAIKIPGRKRLLWLPKDITQNIIKV